MTKENLDNKINKSFILHKDSLSILDKLGDEQAGQLFKAIYQYQNNKELPKKLDPITDLLITPFINQFKRDQEKYEEKCRKNRENAKKRWDATACDRIRMDAKHAYSKKDSKKDSNSKKDSKKDKELKNINKKGFIKPTLEEVEEYNNSRGGYVDAKKFYDYYEAGDWEDQQGNKVKNWKQKLITWENKVNKNSVKNLTGDSFDRVLKEIQSEQLKLK